MTRRDALRLGAMGLSLPALLQLRSASQAATAPTRNTGSGFGKAKRCIVLFAWGGMSHLDTWDLKPDAPSKIRGIFEEIKTSTPGIRLGEHMKHIAGQTHRMAIVRSVHHKAPSHRSAAYWNLTGNPPVALDKNWTATRDDHPCIGSLVTKGRQSDGGFHRKPTNAMPQNICLPYPMYDGGRANGQDGGFLGLNYDPIIVRPKHGKPYAGKSPDVGWIKLGLTEGISKQRFISRRGLLDSLEAIGPRPGHPIDTRTAESFRTQAMDMLLDPKVRKAFDVESEPAAVRKAYGDHICGQSVLMARKLAQAGVPISTVYCSAGDLNGSVGAHWDTHRDNFNRIKNQMLPPLDLASAALLNDLDDHGMLDDTLVVWLTEFGRTPKINGGAGRDHYPNCYSVAFAGGGIQGGQVYGKSDINGAFPADLGCGPADIHATIFHAMGIDTNHLIYDLKHQPHRFCLGKPLPLF